MKEIKKIKKTSLANISALIYALTSFLISIAVIISTIINILTQENFNDSIITIIAFNVGAGFLLAFLISLISGIFGWIIGYIFAVFYNIFAKKICGIKVELIEAGSRKKDDKEKSSENIENQA